MGLCSARTRRCAGGLAFAAATLTLGTLTLGTFTLGSPAGAAQTFLGQFPTISKVASTVPGDGDVNPYGVAVVDQSVGRLVRGDVLVSNFNNAANQQGRGRTIVEISPSGSMMVFARIPALAGGVGLTTALAVLPDGFVIVGNLPTSDGTSATARRGSLLILNRDGGLVDVLAGGDINGPWDLAAQNFGDFAVVFVTNVLNGTVAAGGSVVDHGSVVRLIFDFRHNFPLVLDNTVVASGLAERTDPAALVVGPTGLGIGRDGTLYVADTVHSAIRAIPFADFRFSSAGPGMVVSSGGALNGPLGLTIAPNGDIVTVNGGNGRIVETTPAGVQVAMKFLDKTGTPPGNGALFGLAVAPSNRGLYFVDDDENQLNLLGR